MSLSTLAGTTWTINDSPAISTGATYYVNFTSNNTGYSRLTLSSDPWDIWYDTTMVFIQGWVAGYTVYKTVTFTDGDDIADPALIAWIEAQATRVFTEKEIFNINMNALAAVILDRAGTTGAKTIAQLVEVAESIPDTYGATAVPEVLGLGYTAWVNGEEITGASALDASYDTLRTQKYGT